MSDIILIPLMTFLGFAVGAAWMYRIVNSAIDRYATDVETAHVLTDVHSKLREAESRAVCPTCHNVIVKDAHGGPHPSPGDHDPAYHVATNYGTWHESLGPRR